MKQQLEGISAICNAALKGARGANVAAMVLLSQPIRTAAITGRTDNLAEWFAGRQGGRWAEQMVRSALPPAGAPRPGPPAHAPETSPSGPDPAETLRELTELQQRGVLTEAEFQGLRARLCV